MTPQPWLWLGTIGMAAGAVAILLIGKRRTAAEEADTVIHGIVPIIAACAYLAMALGEGSVTLRAGPGTGQAAHQAVRDFYFARYVDWSFTTPLLLLGLAGTAMHAGRRRAAAVWGLLGSDLLMIVTAFLFGVAEAPAAKWTWFVVSCGAFAAVFYGIFVQLREENAAEREDTRRDFTRNALFLSVLWIVYPVVLVFDQDGLGLLSATAGVAIIAVVDLVAKVGYGLMATLATARRVDRDLREVAAPERGGRLAVAQ